MATEDCANSSTGIHNRLFCEEKKDMQFPECLNDASKYVHSKPKVVEGWVPVRDKSLLEPIDLERLRAIRWLIARSINCASLNSIAIRLAVLASLEKRYGRN